MTTGHTYPFAFLSALGLTLVPTGAAAKDFSAPAGQLGAGLKPESPERFRAYGDLAFFTSSSATLLNSDLGLGFKVLDALELQLDVPIAGVFADGTNQFSLGNAAVSTNWFGGKDWFLWKLGAGVATGPWLNSDSSSEHLAAIRTANFPRSFESVWLWMPLAVNLFVPARLEIGNDLRFTADVSFDIAFPTSSFGQKALYLGLAPGVSYRVSPLFTFGARLPTTLYAAGDVGAQLTFEPFVRADIDKTFLAARFTMPLDEPLGFAFDPFGFWGLQAAVGTTF